MKSQLLSKVAKEFHLLGSKNIPIDSLRTVCLALGPYRNLTTLTASLLFLHPNCQVLNHAGQRIFYDDRLDFIKEYSEERFAGFCRYAINISRKGKRGDYGGSITHSHAFDDKHRMATTFKAASLPLIKNNITALFWKESLRTSNHIRDNNVDLDKLFAQNKKVRFLLPIRNPLDCALSNKKTGHVKIFHGLDKSSPMEAVCDAILDEYLWFKNLESRNPDRFACYFEHEPCREILLRIAALLELPPVEDWLANAAKAFEIKAGYSHPESLVTFYRDSIDKRFSSYPDFAEKLLRFFPQAH
jgi:hypothetical protein